MTNSRNTASILTVIVWVFLIVPQQGKKLAPDLFDNSVIQWTCAIVVAILIPVIVLMTLNMIFTGTRRRAGFWIAVFACLPLLCNLTMYGIVGTMMARTNFILQRGHERDSEMIATLTVRAVSADSAEKRAEWAGLLFTMFGVKPVWKDVNGNFTQYDPTIEEQRKWQQTVRTSMLEKKATEMLDWQLKQMPWLFGLYLGSFTVIIVSGLAWRAYKTKSEHDDPQM